MATTAALTTLSEDERLLRDSVYEFADREIRPLVREMDEHAKIPAPLIDKLFELGRHGHRDSREPTAARGASFFHCGAGGRGAVARRSVDRRARRRAEHARRSTRCCAGAATTSSGAICRSSRQRPIGAYALSEAGSGSDAFALTTRARGTRRRLGAHRPQALDHQRATRPTSSSSSPTSNPDAGYRGITAFLVERGFAGLHRRQEGRQARHPREQHVRADLRGLPRADARTCSARSARATRSRSRR